MNNKAYSYLRFSTPEQMKGDSFRRQTELSQRYAAEHGLDLDDTLTFRDLGVSAFRGANVQAGELGTFLDAVNQGRVKPGSTLLVESLDRLSRQSPYQAFSQLDGILRRGIRVVTLQDGKVYDAENGELEFTDLMVSLLVMQRAHEESVTKSKRGLAAWKAKRNAAAQGGRKLTALCPGWLALDKDRQRFKVIKDRVAIVRRIYEMSLEGVGARSIAWTLNREGIRPFGNSAGWTEDSVRNILINEAVFGRYQPHKRKIENGKTTRVPVGDPIEDYFPRVIDPETFHKARRMRESRKIPAGRSAAAFSNLFTGLAVCGACGGTMHFENKGRPPRGRNYLVCSHARMKLDCPRHAWLYSKTQAHILVNFNELDFRELFPSMYERSRTESDRIEDQITVKEADLEQVAQSLERLADLLLERESSPTLLARLDALEQRKTKLTEELADLGAEYEKQQERLDIAADDYSEVHKAMTHYVKIEREGDPEAIYEARRRLHQLLKRIVREIRFIPSDGSDGLHGTIEVRFVGVEDYFRRIKVEKGQSNSRGFKVAEGKEREDVVVVDAVWPPKGHLVTLDFVADQLLK